MNARAWITRGLAVGHFAWSLVLFLFSLYVARAAFLVLTYMSTGSRWTNLFAAFLLVAQHAMPVGALGVWMFFLGRRLWTGHRFVRRALLVTHGILLVFGLGAMAIGVLALRAAAASAAQGGGLLGGWGAIPLGLGIGLVALAVPSILVATFMPRQIMHSTAV